MTATPLSNSTAASIRPERTSPSPTPRRRGLSSLRRLGPPSPGEISRLSPRNYFTRSTSYPQASLPSHRPIPAESTPSDDPRGLRPIDSASAEIASPDAASHSTPNNHPPATSPPTHQPGTDTEEMARHRPASNLRGASSESIPSAEAQISPRLNGTTSDDAGTVTNAQGKGAAPDTSDEKSRPPTIRFFPHQEIRQGRPSLNFAPVMRTLPNESSIIRVGRYSEREGIPVSNPNGPSDAPVGFKSKVVSRKHCEFSFSNGSWQIKDVSSSSGTFLNHIRLSQPNTESRLYPVKDGDIVQLGIDFRGGEEMIFRCVKIRIECNRAWQKRPNNFK
jgi:E3 ubiquitin-protein ligase DMA1/2